MVFEAIWDDFLSQRQKRLEIVRQELLRCCKGKLLVERKRNRTYFVQYYYEKGKRIRKGITEQPTVIEGLIRRRLLEHEEEHLLDEIKAIVDYKSSIKGFDMDMEISNLKKDFPELPDAMIMNAISSNDSAAWQNEPYEQSTYKVENKKHITSRGLYVRSKSEVLIAEKLYQHSIPFHYEEVIHDNEMLLVPDFTIKRSDGKIIIWEHMGMMTNKNYRSHQKKKLEQYESLGYVPWDNLIITYDNEEGMIDLRVVESEIQNKLL